jgi:hypothetical protein
MSQAYKDDLVNPVHADLATVEGILRGHERGRWGEYPVITAAAALAILPPLPGRQNPS